MPMLTLHRAAIVSLRPRLIGARGLPVAIAPIRRPHAAVPVLLVAVALAPHLDLLSSAPYGGCRLEWNLSRRAGAEAEQ